MCMCPDQPSDRRHVVPPCTAMHHVLSHKHQSFTLILEEDASEWCIRDGVTPAFHLRYPGFKTPAEPERCGDTAAKQTHTNSSQCKALASEWLSRVLGKLTRRLTTAGASAHKSAFYNLIILESTMQYLVLLSCLPSIKSCWLQKTHDSIFCIDFKPSALHYWTAKLYELSAFSGVIWA